MALIKCKECGTEVSSKAEACPKCGARVAAKPMGCGTLIGVILLGGVIISIYSSIFSPSAEIGASSAATSATSPSIIQAAKTSESKRPGSQWSYSQGNDAMSKGVIHQARVSSSNTVEFSSPYSGAQHAALVLRTHPRFGRDIIFTIERGQFLCRSYEDCTVLIRFDDEQGINFGARGPADNSTETVFIHNYDRFIAKMSKAKRVRVSTNIYRQGAPVFDFDVSGFDKSSYTAKK
ncbi:MAG: zinc ribbon domain-containing protein [Betaproteobacteria bacterium]|nr:zinc ribbon domain-containing protein [Betaproteobacteria bacterium]